MAHLYQYCGHTSTGEVIRYPLTTQIVTEVPESLETSQKQDRRRVGVFEAAQRSENEEEYRVSMPEIDRETNRMSG